mmetsp:Transcript_14911/g.56153  ORF Transcript_14911/g.56153 Transcript_14911/m.56153 type:complete len:227 (+) Transcript_14911:156-836(+)
MRQAVAATSTAVSPSAIPAATARCIAARAARTGLAEATHASRVGIRAVAATLASANTAMTSCAVSRKPDWPDLRGSKPRATAGMHPLVSMHEWLPKSRAQATDALTADCSTWPASTSTPSAAEAASRTPVTATTRAVAAAASTSLAHPAASPSAPMAEQLRFTGRAGSSCSSPARPSSDHGPVTGTGPSGAPHGSDHARRMLWLVAASAAASASASTESQAAASRA